MRTDYLFRLANHNGGLVVGTGDLSELALGWCTYGVGDQMSHYNPNGSVSKTLIQHLIRFVAATRRRRARRPPRCCCDILGDRDLAGAGAGRRRRRDPVDREHRRPLRAAGFQPVLHDPLRLRAVEDRLPVVERLARCRAGRWPANMPAARGAPIDLPEIRHWLRRVLRRFFEQSQFKRSALPNGPKISSGGSLSPRGDWRAPSDSHGRGLARRTRAQRPGHGVAGA